MLHTYMDSQEALKDDNDARVGYAEKYLKKDRFIYRDPVRISGKSNPVSLSMISVLCPELSSGVQTISL